MANDPASGDVIPGGQGLRKIRVALPGRGRRGGGRVIYLRTIAPGRVLLLAIYAKNAREDLDADDLQNLRRLAQLMQDQLHQLDDE